MFHTMTSPSCSGTACPHRPSAGRGTWGQSRATGAWTSWVPVTYFLPECHCTWPVTDSTEDLNSNYSSIADLGSFSWNHRPSSGVGWTALWKWLRVRFSQTTPLVYVKKNILSALSGPLWDNNWACYSKKTSVSKTFGFKFFPICS